MMLSSVSTATACTACALWLHALRGGMTTASSFALEHCQQDTCAKHTSLESLVESVLHLASTCRHMCNVGVCHICCLDVGNL